MYIFDFVNGALICLTSLLTSLMCFQVSLLELQKMPPMPCMALSLAGIMRVNACGRGWLTSVHSSEVKLGGMFSSLSKSSAAFAAAAVDGALLSLGIRLPVNLLVSSALMQNRDAK